MFPTTYNCLSNKYTITEVPIITLNCCSKDEQVLGRFKYSTQKIEVDKKLPKKIKEHTIAHEIIHSWLATTGLTNRLSSKEEELFCDSLGHCLIDLLKEYTLK